MTNDFPRDLAIKVDQLLDAVSAGRLIPDPFDLLHAASTLRQHGELARADRCIAIARRLLLNLSRNPIDQA